MTATEIAAQAANGERNRMRTPAADGAHGARYGAYQ